MRKTTNGTVAHSTRRVDDLTDAGFTLIEMMIVVVVISVLTSVAIVAYKRHLRTGRVIEAREFISRIQARQETYFQQNGQYVTASTSFYPAMSTEPIAKTWGNPVAVPAGWTSLGARPESNSSYFSFLVQASTAPNHTVGGGGTAATLNLVSGHPWYYSVAHGDLDGDGTYASGGCNGVLTTTTCTILTATSARSTIVSYNEGE